MSKLQTSIFACVFAVIGIFLTSDCDLFLYLALPPPENAFQGKVVWITGASSGIGASLALEIVKSGGEVIISARREDLLDEVAKNCSYFGKEPMVLPLDVTNYENQKKAYDKIINKYGKIDSLVLNAGRSQRAPALDTDIHDTEDLMKLNYFSFVSLARTVVPAMVSHGGGQVFLFEFFLIAFHRDENVLEFLSQVVVVSSVSGKFGTPVGSSYSGTKFALVRHKIVCFHLDCNGKVIVTCIWVGCCSTVISMHFVLSWRRIK